MTKSSITLSRQQRLWLKDLILADIHDWQDMAARPVDEVGILFANLADIRIRNMQTLLAKLDVFESVETLQQAHKSGLVSDIVRKCDCGALIVLQEP